MDTRLGKALLWSLLLLTWIVIAFGAIGLVDTLLQP